MGQPKKLSYKERMEKKQITEINSIKDQMKQISKELTLCKQYPSKYAHDKTSELLIKIRNIQNYIREHFVTDNISIKEITKQAALLSSKIQQERYVSRPYCSILKQVNFATPRCF